MDNHIPPMMFLTICFSLLTTLPQSHSDQHDSSNNHYADCSQPFNCGPAVPNVSYPFWGDHRPEYCGGGSDFKLHCDDEDDGQHASIQIGLLSFGVLHINNTNYTLRMPRQVSTTDVCSAILNEIDNNNTLSRSPFRYTNPEALNNITIFYACPNDALLGDNHYKCPPDEYPIAFYDYEDVNDTMYGKFPGLRGCRGSITVPVPKSVRLDPNGGNITALYEALRARFEFDVKYNVRFAKQCAACVKSGGACGTSNNFTFQFTCHCPHGSDARDCSDGVYFELDCT